MKNTYTVPLKVFIYYHSFDSTSVKFQLESDTSYYSMEIDTELGIKENKIVASLNGKEYLFSPEVKVKCTGRNLKAMWKYWKENGSTQFEEWFVQKKNIL